MQFKTFLLRHAGEQCHGRLVGLRLVDAHVVTGEAVLYLGYGSAREHRFVDVDDAVSVLPRLLELA